MRWRKEYPNHWDTRTRFKFAWFPMMDPQSRWTYWLEKVLVTEQWVSGRGMYKDEWIIRSVA
jgi:hypothetical protein